MKKNLKIRLVIISASGFLFLLDQFLKWQAAHNWINSKTFLNQGAAFGLPFPNSLIIGLTAPIILTLLYLLIKEKNNLNFLTWSLILTGAVSNFFDRIYYHHVIDYFAFVTGIINISDVLIVIGLIIYLLNLKKIPRYLSEVCDFNKFNVLTCSTELEVHNIPQHQLL